MQCCSKRPHPDLFSWQTRKISCMAIRKSVHSYLDNDWFSQWNEPHAQSSLWNHNRRFPGACRRSRQPPESGLSQGEDGWGVQGVIRLVPTAAAAAVGDPARLVGVRLRGAALLEWRMGCTGPTGFWRGRWVGENHPDGEGGERGCRCEHWGVERLGFVAKNWGGGCHRFAWDRYLWFGLLHFHR